MLAIESMPPLLKPAKGRYRLQDYEKIFCADLAGGQDILADILQMSGQSAPFGWRILHFEFGGMVNLSF